MVNSIEDLILYQKAVCLTDLIFPIAEKWSYFYQITNGTQLVRTADSIPANISEGYGRFYFKDSKSFYYYARGSLYETRTHLTLARNRNLISKEKADELLKLSDELLRILNGYINSIGHSNQP